jgi:multiple sugar transport system substrate-binding protein
MSRKTVVLLSLLVILGLVLVACGGGEQAAEEPEQAAAEKVTVRLGTWAGVDEAAELQEILDRLNAESDTYQIIHEPQPADYYTKLQTSLTGKVSADMFWLSQEWIAGLANQGVLADITDCVAASDSPAADLNDYFPEILKTAQYEGGLYGLPWIAQPVVLYYNKGLFDEAGIAYPDESWDWDKLLEVSAALTMDTDGDGNNDQWGFTVDGWPPPQMFVWQAGGEVITPDLASSPIDTPEAAAGWTFYQDLIWNDVNTPPQAILVERGAGNMFKQGSIAMFMGGAADDLDRVDGLDVGISVVPAGPAGRPTFAWNASTVVASNAENPDVVCEALLDVSDGIHHWKIVPPRESLATVEKISEIDPRKAANAEDIVKAVPDMRGFNIIPRQQEWDNDFLKNFADPLFNKADTPGNLAAANRPNLEAYLP